MRRVAARPVVLLYGSDDSTEVTGLAAGIQQIRVQLRRNPRPFEDLLSLGRLIRLLTSLHPALVVMSTPKMAMLGLLAARLCRVPSRIYILYGLRLEGSTGLRRWVLGRAEKLAMSCATHVVSISQSLADTAERHQLVDAGKISVPGAGGTGVDLDRFQLPSDQARSAARRQFGLPPDVPVLGYVGRLARDKGISELCAAWRDVHAEIPEARLLVVGPEEHSDAAFSRTLTELSNLPNVVRHGPTQEIQTAFAAIDCLALLTRREGFGQVLIEAAACEVPTVATRVTGVVDAVVDGVTGTLVPAGDSRAAAEAIIHYLQSEPTRAQAGKMARARAESDFEIRTVSRHWINEILKNSCLRGDDGNG
jgi:glycosyltransferase involved in cell wall biosynthesis